MATNERHTFSERVWFDANNPGPLHDALRTDYAQAKAAINQRPSLRRHMESCSVCQAITAATVGAPAPTAGRKRLKLRIDPAGMHRLLNLPENFEIVHMFAADDPNAVFVLVAGEGLPETDPAAETPTVIPDMVTGHTRDRAS
jgi:hypothetical protein